MSIWVETTSESARRPSSTTAAAVSSHDVSSPSTSTRTRYRPTRATSDQYRPAHGRGAGDLQFGSRREGVAVNLARGPGDPTRVDYRPSSIAFTSSASAP